MATRNKEKILIPTANTERLRNSSVYNMRHLLNEEEKKKYKQT